MINRNDIKTILIWGTLVECRCIEEMIKEFYPQIQIVGYASHRYDNLGYDAKTGRKIISLQHAENMILDGTSDAIIVVVNTIKYSAFERFNISDNTKDKAFLVPLDVLKKGGMSRDNKAERIFTPYKGNGVSTIQFLLTENCNLNCKLCSHFSPLVKERNIYEFESFKKDIYRTREIFSCVSEIGLWGGEVLLVPELHKYIRCAREVFPYSKITLGTNGLLIKQLSKELIESIRTNNAVFYITIYPPLKDRVDDITDFLQERGLKYEFSRLSQVERFGKRYDLSGDNDPKERFRYCNSRYCSTVQNGKFAVCYFPLLAHRYNEYYGKQYFDTSLDIIDLYDDLTEERIMHIMQTPLQSCRYCGEWEFEDWQQAREDIQYLDWVK